MLRIDEAIQRENKIAEENQKIVDTQIVFDDVSIPELYCDDTEVIEEHLDNYKKCVEYHEQIAEWLEELKVLRLQNHLGRDEALIAGRKEGYNKAIDDFAKWLENKKYLMKEIQERDFCYTHYDELKANCVTTEYFAEQLKAGGKNEKERNAFDNAKQIVQEVAEEFAPDTNVGTNGWIPCSVRLPEEPFGCLVTVIDCEPVTQTDFENILPYFVGYDGESWNDEDGNEIPFEVIAWMPLPEPYKESDE